MKNKKYLYIIIFLLVTITSCDNETPLDKEQYFSQIYLVDAFDHVTTREIPYQSQEQEVFISTAVGGTLSIDKDITVNLSSQNTVVEWYNKKYKYLPEDVKYQLLEPTYFSVPSYTATIKKGESYSRIPVKVVTEGLHCDSLYAITFKVESVVDNYAINEADSALILSFKLTNDYSGLYLFEGTRYTVNVDDGTTFSPTNISITRNLKAVNENTVRFFNEQKAETIANTPANCVTLSIEEDSSISIAAWDDFLFKEGECSYSEDVFILDYKYESDGQLYQITGKMTKQIEKK